MVTAWELLGAVVGAGMASGREIASFFAQYGLWSFPGIVLAVFTMLFLADALPHGRLWNVLLSLLLIATGGAMLSGAGHLAALTLNLQHASSIGTVGTLLLAMCLARKTTSGLAWVSSLLLIVMLVLISGGFFIDPMAAVAIDLDNPAEALLRAVTYGGFNAALMLPVLTVCPLRGRKRRFSIMLGCGLAAVLIGLGCLVLLRHPALIAEPMPFVMLAAQFGVVGYYLSASSLYLAILSTLIVCIRGAGNVLCIVAMLLISCFGFEDAVGMAYPVLGAACFLMLAGAKITKITNSFR